jgi:cysteine dioxygenase
MNNKIFQIISSINSKQNICITDIKKIFDSTMYKLNIDDVFSYITDPCENPYNRKVIYSSGLYELILMTWKKETYCLPHNHGISEGLAYVLHGNVQNLSLNLVDNCLNISEFKKGDNLLIDKNLIHTMKSLGEETLVTMHFYTPSISNMRIYDVKNNRQCIVNDNCGAWWPKDEQQIIKLEDFDKRILLFSDQFNK